MPKTGTAQPQQQTRQQASDNASPRQAPPPPGMGKLIDKTV